ncbi:hypothetical protein [Pedosphaera parvula]|uniref:Uncharacterized protein n=1 Tax=Pedosphaera parvula (strain Ellin514) TaxID=320771 RepID=B9XLX8_PEDPL|nr:hypothetical protein [Pedosphaera parvula]EEF59106.1 hypothetical protein Cflav_PD1598 [Pedosphaera parvula Ellin514]
MVSVNQGVAKKRNKKRLFLTILSCLFVFGGTVYGYYRYKFPYGSSHCCIVQFGLALRMYAADNHGKFPAGGATPEASLALLGTGGYLGGDNAGAYLLRGKTVPLEVTLKAIQQGTLNSNSTGWHYVEGLTEADDQRIAIVWDKVGLGHNGQRLKNGGHEVLLLDGSHSLVNGSKWTEFLEQQKELLAHGTKSASK